MCGIAKGWGGRGRHCMGRRHQIKIRLRLEHCACHERILWAVSHLFYRELISRKEQKKKERGQKK